MKDQSQERLRQLDEIGKCAFEHIAELVAALECDYDRLEELREAYASNTFSQEDEQELAELIAAAGDCKDRDDAERRIHEGPLSVEVRSDWHVPGDSAHPAEFRILLSTGGPATRIIGELNEYGEPTSAKLQVQNWFTPWTEYRGADEEVLLTYCRCFYFGED